MRNRRGRKEKQNVQSGNYKNIKIYYILHLIYDSYTVRCTIVPYDTYSSTITIKKFYT
mgnify:CR=1 FL=1